MGCPFGRSPLLPRLGFLRRALFYPRAGGSPAPARLADADPEPLDGGPGRKGGAPFRETRAPVLPHQDLLPLSKGDGDPVGRHLNPELVAEDSGRVGVAHGGLNARLGQGPRLLKGEGLDLNRGRETGQHVEGEAVEQLHAPLLEVFQVKLESYCTLLPLPTFGQDLLSEALGAFRPGHPGPKQLPFPLRLDPSHSQGRLGRPPFFLPFGRALNRNFESFRLKLCQKRQIFKRTVQFIT